MVHGELPTGLVGGLVRIAVALGSVVSGVGEIERPFYHLVGVTHTGRVAYEVLVVVSVVVSVDCMRRFSC